MMASLDFTLAWSLEVPVEILGAHLQAYVELQPTFQTLRLCNRYGQGPQAAVTTIPVELVKEIEGLLMEDEREKQRMNWAQDFRCYQGLCEPIHHLSNTEQIEMWLDIEDCFECPCTDSEGEGGCLNARPMDALNPSQRKTLVGFLDDVVIDEGREESPGWMEHENRCARWEGKTGIPTFQQKGRDFGLDLWVTHTKSKDSKTGQFTVVGVYASTVVYLTLPHARTHRTLERGIHEGDTIDPPFLSAESGGATVVTMPTALSVADASRFSRALKVLDLAPPRLTGKDSTAAADEDDSAEKEEGADDHGATTDTAPQLAVLYRQGVDG